ncbi:MAG: hypothetical protein RHS_2488 [Robinsoniella sp. RHS]|uniref:DUF4179 domain-containing protein n=1 Tax=Robinsoniella TaxID=588605 RepID=UPI000649DDCC|nr:DUF4179 domain-containing protein [Robinsoniella peoriensis]KLU71774.1 MAG: hypothetical protein RHS_2488 [Robinsoniella sp. RHS]
MFNNWNEVPTSDRLDETIMGGMKQVKKIRKKQVIKKVTLGAGSTVALITAFFIWGFYNPVLAAEIPVIGGIFKDIENEVEFSGNFSEKAQNLEGAAMESNDAGLLVKAEEAYCDGSSIYVTLSISGEQPFQNMYDEYTDEDGITHLPTLMLEGNARISEGGELQDNAISKIEGRLIDEHTFQGMMKIDLDEDYTQSDKSFNLKLNLDSITYEDSKLAEESIKNEKEYEIPVGENEKPKFKEGYEPIIPLVTTQGNWQMDLNVKVDTDSVKVYDINKESNGFGIEKVIVTPYEVKVKTILPGLYANQEEIFAVKKKYYKEGKAAALKEGNTWKDLTDEEIDENYWIATTGDYAAAVFDQNGQKLDFSYEEGSQNGSYQVYPLQGRKITKLSVYVGENAISTFKEKDQKAMASRALYGIDIDLTK